MMRKEGGDMGDEEGKRGEIMEIRVFMCLISSLSFIFVGFECFYNGVFANITKFLFRNFPKFVLRKIVS